MWQIFGPHSPSGIDTRGPGGDQHCHKAQSELRGLMDSMEQIGYLGNMVVNVNLEKSREYLTVWCKKFVAHLICIESRINQLTSAP